MVLFRLSSGRLGQLVCLMKFRGCHTVWIIPIDPLADGKAETGARTHRCRIHRAVQHCCLIWRNQNRSESEIEAKNAQKSETKAKIECNVSLKRVLVPRSAARRFWGPKLASNSRYSAPMGMCANSWSFRPSSIHCTLLIHVSTLTTSYFHNKNVIVIM